MFISASLIDLPTLLAVTLKTEGVLGCYRRSHLASILLCVPNSDDRFFPDPTRSLTLQ